MKKPLIHTVIWLILGYFMLVFFSLFLPVYFAVARTLIVLIFMAGIFYASGWVLTPAFLIRRKEIVWFVILSIFLVVIFSFLRLKLLELLQEHVIAVADRLKSQPGHLFRSMIRERVLENRYIFRTGHFSYFSGFIMNAIILVIGMLIRLYEHKNQKEKESREKLQHTQEAQIQYLKSQVNPHFLFNTLNNLYGLTYSKSDLAPKMVLGLSETMRYMIYETEQKLVPIEKEIYFIKNYLDLEKMRITHPENIRISINVENPAAYIPPLLLLPFIENSFKHGRISREKDGWIEIDIKEAKDRFYFICKNNYSDTAKRKDYKKSSGVGLMNAGKRLELIFGEKYQLTIRQQQGEYNVTLQFPVFNKKDEL